MIAFEKKMTRPQGVVQHKRKVSDSRVECIHLYLSGASLTAVCRHKKVSFDHLTMWLEEPDYQHQYQPLMDSLADGQLDRLWAYIARVEAKRGEVG